METKALTDFASQDDPVPIAVLITRPDLVRALQFRLMTHGLLAPPVDGVLAPGTQWALVEFCRAARLPFEGTLTPAAARALLQPEPILPLRPAGDLAGRVAAAMQRRGDWVCRHPAACTIVYVERMQPDGQPTAQHPDSFDDTRMLLRIDEHGVPELLGAWEATTTSGRPAVEQPATAKGAPRLALGQHRAWVLGRTALGTELEQEALIQVAPLPVSRDANRDFRRDGDAVETGLYAIDQHGGQNAPRDRVGGIGAGCLIGRCADGHASFIERLRQDPRWQVDTGTLFQTSLIDFSMLS